MGGLLLRAVHGVCAPAAPPKASESQGLRGRKNVWKPVEENLAACDSGVETHQVCVWAQGSQCCRWDLGSTNAVGSQLAPVLAEAATTLVPAASREVAEKTRNDMSWWMPFLCCEIFTKTDVAGYNFCFWVISQLLEKINKQINNVVSKVGSGFF